MTKRKRSEQKKKKNNRQSVRFKVMVLSMAFLVLLGAVALYRSWDSVDVNVDGERAETLLEALDRYTADIAQDNNPQAYLERANLYYQIGNFEAAITDYSAVLDAEPDNHTAWYGRGLVFEALGDAGNAIADLKRAIELDPQPEYHRALGNVYYQLERHDEALAQYEVYADAVLRPDETILDRITVLSE